MLVWYAGVQILRGHHALHRDGTGAAVLPVRAEVMSGGRFERCMRYVFGEEGGYSNNPADKGKATNLGITQATLDRARGQGWTRVENVRDLTRFEAEQVYWNGYWIAPRCYAFPAPLDLLAFDAFVQHRPTAAAEIMQTAVGTVPDGIIGPKTIDAAHKVDPVSAIERYAYARERLYRQIVKADPTQTVFLKGWLNRVAHVKAAALAEVV